MLENISHILIVEDTESDIELIRQMFREMKVKHTLSVARDGSQALDYMYQRGRYQDAKRPSLILLDLNLPRTSGLDVLRSLKNDINYQSIPTIILTSSQADEDIARAYADHANSYITKPIDLDSFMEVVENIEKYWLSTVELPR